MERTAHGVFASQARRRSGVGLFCSGILLYAAAVALSPLIALGSVIGRGIRLADERREPLW